MIRFTRIRGSCVVGSLPWPVRLPAGGGVGVMFGDDSCPVDHASISTLGAWKSPISEIRSIRGTRSEKDFLECGFVEMNASELPFPSRKCLITC